jgi:hypothetical protein
MYVSSELQRPAALPPAEDIKVHTEQKLGRLQGRVCMLWKRLNPLPFPGNQTSDYPSHSLVTIQAVAKAIAFTVNTIAEKFRNLNGRDIPTREYIVLYIISLNFELLSFRLSVIRLPSC